MIATLRFKLPEEQQEHIWAIRGDTYYAAIQHLAETLRRKIKYEDTKPASWEEVRTVFWEVMSEYDINTAEERYAALPNSSP